MKTPIIRIKATIRYITAYHCTACDRQQAGGTATVEVDTPAGLAQFLDNPPQRPHDMPVGWASHLDSGFTCGCAATPAGRKVKP